MFFGKHLGSDWIGDFNQFSNKSLPPEISPYTKKCASKSIHVTSIHIWKSAMMKWKYPKRYLFQWLKGCLQRKYYAVMPIISMQNVEDRKEQDCQLTIILWHESSSWVTNHLMFSLHSSIVSNKLSGEYVLLSAWSSFRNIEKILHENFPFEYRGKISNERWKVNKGDQTQARNWYCQVDFYFSCRQCFVCAISGMFIDD